MRTMHAEIPTLYRAKITTTREDGGTHVSYHGPFFRRADATRALNAATEGYLRAGSSRAGVVESAPVGEWGEVPPRG